MADAPYVIVFDVNETLSDMAPMRGRWEAAGAPGTLAGQWFAEVLRDGFALTAAGSTETFAVLAEQTARRLLRPWVGEGDLDGAVERVMAGFGELDVHADVPDGVRRLGRTGARLVTLTNGATSIAERLLVRAGLREEFAALLSVEDAGRWKPAPEAYRYAGSACGAPAERMMLVAVHPWDIDGAARAGLRTAWVNRAGAVYPSSFTPPDVVVTSLPQLADVARFAAPPS